MRRQKGVSLVKSHLQSFIYSILREGKFLVSSYEETNKTLENYKVNSLIFEVCIDFEKAFDI